MPDYDRLLFHGLKSEAANQGHALVYLHGVLHWYLQGLEVGDVELTLVGYAVIACPVPEC